MNEVTSGFLQLAARRRSVRGYAAQPVEREKPAPITGWRSVTGLLFWLGITCAAAVIGGAATVQAGVFYAELVRPVWSPPGWLFGPVWSLLYTFMAIAAWRVWRARGLRAARWALGLYVAQLAVNAVWSWMFFAWRLGGLAFYWILLLGVLVLWLIHAFRRINRLAAWLLYPYFAWLVLAAALSLAVWRLNPGQLL